MKEGDEVAAGDVLCDVETGFRYQLSELQASKPPHGLQALTLQCFDGSCHTRLQDIPVGTPVLILVEDEEHIGAFADYKPDSSAASEEQSADAASGGSSMSKSAPGKGRWTWRTCTWWMGIACMAKGVRQSAMGATELPPAIPGVILLCQVALNAPKPVATCTQRRANGRS